MRALHITISYLMLAPFLFVVLAIMTGCSRPDRETPAPDAPPIVTSEPQCAGSDGLLDGRGVGRLRIGMSVDSARAVCPSAIDTIEYVEGQALRVLVETIEGDTLRIRIVQDTVSSVLVQTPVFATADSLAAGMSIAQLLSVPELAGGFGEGEFFVWSNDERWCGLSFRLDDATARAQEGKQTFTRAALEPFANSGHVTAILAYGCKR